MIVDPALFRRVEGSARSNVDAANGNSLHPVDSGTMTRITADARSLPLASDSIDLVVTSPPYWRKRDYGFKEQIGQERTPEEYVNAIRLALSEWRRVLRVTGSVFLNVGDTYYKRSLVGIPGMIEHAATADGWLLRNRIIWSKRKGMPSPPRDRLANRHEFILHFAVSPRYFYDLHGYAEFVGSRGTPGDVWDIDLTRNFSDHLAPFPEEIVRRAVVLACPSRVCTRCDGPSRRIVRRTHKLDMNRPQARRALVIAEAAGLTTEHINAVQATGISDAGKALLTQNGTGRNSERVKQLAEEAKRALGGYFREFTFAKRETAGYSRCSCRARFKRGIVLDPFAGSGTTLRVATDLGRDAIGVDFVDQVT